MNTSPQLSSLYLILSTLSVSELKTTKRLINSIIKQKTSGSIFESTTSEFQEFKELEKLLKERKSSVFFYYAGHGNYYETKNYPFKKTGKKVYDLYSCQGEQAEDINGYIYGYNFAIRKQFPKKSYEEEIADLAVERYINTLYSLTSFIEPNKTKKLSDENIEDVIQKEPKQKRSRTLGIWKGQVKISDDFYETSSDILAEFGIEE